VLPGLRFGTTILAIVILTLVATPSPARAHGDSRLAADRFTLAPGETVSFTGQLHYHRLVGRVSADGPVTVRLVNVMSGEVAVEAGPARTVAFNDLIRCCDTSVWAAHELVIENVSRSPVAVDARITLVHDDLAVMVDGAESGTRTGIVWLGALWVWVLVRAVRRRQTVAHDDRSARMVLLRTASALAVLATTVLMIAVYGAGRYGQAGAPALVAGLADLPVLPMNPIVSRASLLMGLGMVAWAWVGGRWARVGPEGGHVAWVVLGASLVGAVGATAVAVGVAYGDVVYPAVFGLVASGPILGLLLRDRPRATRAAPVI
jgi:hypothetical protein